MWQYALLENSRYRQLFYPPSHFRNDAFSKDERVFFVKILCSSFFYNFSNFEIFLFFAKKFYITWKRHFEKQYLLIRLLQQVCHLKRYRRNSRFFFKKNILFHNTTQILNVLRNLKSHSTTNLLHFGEKNLRSESVRFQTSDIINWQMTGRKKGRVERMIFVPCYK